MTTHGRTQTTTDASHDDRSAPRRGHIGRITALATAVVAVAAGLAGLALDPSDADRSLPDPSRSSIVEGAHDTAGAGHASTTASRPTASVDELVDVDGSRMHVRCAGSGPTTAVLIAGFEVSSEIWDAMAPAAAEEARVCSYDRFGTGTSDPAPRPQTFASQADDLHAALTSLGEIGPYVVVGHSFGGGAAVVFADAFRSEVAGLLLVDASPTTWPATLCSVPDDGTAAAAGYRRLCTHVSTPAENAERLDGPRAFAEVAAIGSLDDLPMVVMTATQHPWGLSDREDARLDDAWAAGEDHWVSLSSAARPVTVEDTGHDIHVDRPAAVIEQIRGLIR